MPFTRVCAVADLPPESVTEVLVRNQPYAICHVGGEVRALSGVCIHHGGPLGHGTIHNGNVVCPFHMWEFDCATGAYDYDASKRVPTFPVKVEDGEVWIEVP
jgi:nitrite reductase/ring-hydroxylating ferredoxin subunit